MKILMLTNTYRPFTGGVPRSIDTFAHQYRNLGHIVKIVAPDCEGQVEEADVIRVPALKNFNGTEFSVQWPVPFFLSEFVDNFKPDIVHSQHPFLLGNTALRLAVGLNIPLIYTFHTFYEHYLHYLPGGETEALKRFVITLASGYANLCDHVIAPSRYVAGELKRRLVNKPIDIIPTGVDVEGIGNGDGEAFRTKNAIPADAFLVGFVSRLVPEKNLVFLCDAVLEFLAANPKAWFVIAGTGSSEGDLKIRFSTIPLGARIVMLGNLEGKDLHDGYQAMDVFAFASQSETQGLVIAEAMAAATPTVAVQAPGVEDIVSDGYNGRLLGKENPKEFAAALEWIASRDEGQMAVLKNNALKTAQDFSDKASALKVLALYKTARRETKAQHEFETAWDDFMNVVSAEWNLLANLGAAAGHAWFESETKVAT
jgi:1,2-diacylglycerol 3-alpha-glucosyltransferase